MQAHSLAYPPSGSTGLRPLADGLTPLPLRLLLALLLPPLELLCALGAVGPSRAAVMAAIAALNSCSSSTHNAQSGLDVRSTTCFCVHHCVTRSGIASQQAHKAGSLQRRPAHPV